ncbi:MAG: sensor domain-containing diguanylate cyclase [Ketobacter sp.]|nr:MAG: sensor domain-containing diguanylate cyclase [Ketobacter sp.]
MSHSKVDNLTTKIAKNNKSFSLLLAVGGLFAAFFSGGVRAETIEILYEQGDAGGFVTSDWIWILFFLLAAFGVVLWLVRSHFLQLLANKEEDLDRAHMRLHEAQRIARIGSWTRNFETGETFWSNEAKVVLGLDEAAVEIPHYESLIHPDDLDRVTEVVASAYFQGGSYQCDHRVVGKDGFEKHIRLAGQVVLGEASSPVHETGTVQDITDRKLAEMALQRSEERMRSILNAAPYPILILELAEEYPVLYANASAYNLFGLNEAIVCEELKSKEFWSVPEDRMTFIDTVQNDEHVFETEMVMKSQGNRTFWASLTGSQLEFGGIRSVFISVMDITQRKRIQQELERLATTDSLTGLYNRRSFFEFANKELRRAVRYKQPMALLMLDLDHFKAVNDSYGHQAGDNVLRRFAEILKQNLREEDLMGRIGGEEFCAILVSSEEQGAYLVAERIRKRWMEETFDLEERPVAFTVSIGISIMLNERESIEDVMERADIGLYSAKRSGRNCVIVQGADAGTHNQAEQFR